MSKVKFVDLPEGRNSGFSEFWSELAANPGRWAEYPGVPTGVYSAAKQRSTLNGVRYECCMYQGKGYARAVAS